MCFGAFFSGSDQKRKSSQSHSKNKRQNVRSNSLHRGNTSTVTKIPERKSPERPNSKRSREPNAKVDGRVRPSYTQNHGGNYRPHLVVQAPSMWYRPAESSLSSDPSQEMLLNPRPRRTAGNTRQQHNKYTSQSTLKGRGAKRQRTTEDGRDDQVHSRRIPKRSQYQTLGDDTTQAYRSAGQYQYHHPEPPGSRPIASRRYHSHLSPPMRPNTSARRDPDRRFAVLAATNTALEHLRREAFAQPSPPPRGERLRRYQGVTIPASSIPFEWDCVSSQYSSRHGESSSRQRARR